MFHRLKKADAPQTHTAPKVHGTPLSAPKVPGTPLEDPFPTPKGSLWERDALGMGKGYSSKGVLRTKESLGPSGWEEHVLCLHKPEFLG